MVCYYFPPVQSAGCTRSVSFARALPELGWEPTVLTVDRTRDPWVRTGESVPSRMRIVRTREWALARLLDLGHAALARVFRHETNYLREVFAVPDTQIAWSSTIPGALLAREHDAIYVSCSPFSSAVSGCLMKLVSGKPLVVDLRDAWTLNPHARRTWFRSRVEAWLESYVFAHADRIVVNTEGAARLYRATYPEAAGKILAIPNGYDALAPARPVSRKGPFRIVHLGSFYGSRRPDALVDALARLRHLPIEFVQVGGGYARPEDTRGARVTVIDTLPRERALELLEGASVLYLKQGREPGVTRHIAIAAKTYEYLATGLPILADLPEGDNAELVARYATDATLVTSGSSRELEAAILSLYDRRGAVPSVHPEFVRDFDRRSLTALLARTLDGLVAPLQETFTPFRRARPSAADLRGAPS
jgi:glycosyltransferase involved in cell wall biosynthesis